MHGLSPRHSLAGCSCTPGWIEVECPASNPLGAGAGGHMKLGIDPKVDVAFRKVFGSEDNALLLIDLLHAVVRPARPFTGLELVLPQSEKAAPDDKLAIGDVRARDQGNRQFHLEMQWQVPWFFPKRALFYWARFHPQ